MSVVEFPTTEKQIEIAMDDLCAWNEKYLEMGVSPIILIGLMETYKAALTNNLLVDEDEE